MFLGSVKKRNTLKLKSSLNFSVFLNKSVSEILVFLRFLEVPEGLERSGTLRAVIPPIFVKNAWCGDEL